MRSGLSFKWIQNLSMGAQSVLVLAICLFAYQGLSSVGAPLEILDRPTVDLQPGQSLPA